MDRRVKVGNGTNKLIPVHSVFVVKDLGKFFDSVVGDFGDLPDMVLVSLKVLNFGIKDLPSSLVRLFEDCPAIFCIGVVSKVSAFVQKTFAI